MTDLHKPRGWVVADPYSGEWVYQTPKRSEARELARECDGEVLVVRFYERPVLHSEIDK